MPCSQKADRHATSSTNERDSAALMPVQKGFFVPRPASPLARPAGTLEATSFYDTRFSRRPWSAWWISIASMPVRRASASGPSMSAPATSSISTTPPTTIRPEHVMASGALPPGFPAVEIEGEHYWDGGLVSNTPLQWVVGKPAAPATRWRSRSISGARTASFRATCRSRHPGEGDPATRAAPAPTPTSSSTSRSCGARRWELLSTNCPQDLRSSPEARLLAAEADRKVYGLVHLIYRARDHEGHSKDYEFSRLSMEEHWRAGYHDAVRTLRHPQVLERPDHARRRRDLRPHAGRARVNRFPSHHTKEETRP